jgi:hypothetical protein
VDPRRLLFASIHCYLAPSSGVALCTRELLEAPAARGAERRAPSMGVLDYRQEVSLDEVLAGLGLPSQRSEAALAREGTAEVIDLTVNGLRVTLLPTSSTRAERSPDPRESALLLDLADQVLERFRPQALLTCGGHPASVPKRPGIPKRPGTYFGQTG